MCCVFFSLFLFFFFFFVRTWSCDDNVYLKIKIPWWHYKSFRFQSQCAEIFLSWKWSTKVHELVQKALFFQKKRKIVAWSMILPKFQNIAKRLLVVYWPPTRPSCQKKKCTSINNRRIRSKISGDQGWPWQSRGWIECEIVTLAGSRWASNYYITSVTGSSVHLEIRSVGENMLEWGPCPREAGPPGPRNAIVAIRVWVNMLQFSSVSNSPLTQLNL